MMNIARCSSKFIRVMLNKRQGIPMRKLRGMNLPGPLLNCHLFQTATLLQTQQHFAGMPGLPSNTILRSIFNSSSTVLPKMPSEIYEGVFAINKPTGISSAQVIRDVQRHFSPSALFQPWLDREHARRESESHNQKVKRKWRGKRGNEVKMGHGGTLDPMATGILILGVGQGTKELGYFTTGCTKSYEAVVLFGAATDSYDTEGKVLKRAETSHITKELVEEKLASFKGKGVQRPPVFSALKVQGKKLYEYAREGKEVPVEIKERPVDASDLEMVEWFPGGSHEWHWPTAEASEEEKAFAEKLLSKTEKGKSEVESRKRERQGNAAAGEEEELQSSKRVKAEDEKATEVKPTSIDEPPTDRPPCPAPACRIRMTVTSGFYVRTLCHDLGAAVGSLACMSGLVRTSQGGFDLGSNVLWFDELKQGEDVWGPKVKAMLIENQKRSDARMDRNDDGKAQKQDSQTKSKKESDIPDSKPTAVDGAEHSGDVHPKEASNTADLAAEGEENAAKAAPPADNRWRAGY